MTNQELLQVYSAYLPYKLNWFIDFEDGDTAVYEMLGLFADSGEVYLDGYETSVDAKNCKPILRSMSKVVEYFEEIYGTLEYQDVTDYLDADYLNDYGNLEIEDLENIEPENLTYGTLQVLLKHHYDIFGLIDKGLAINLNEVK